MNIKYLCSVVHSLSVKVKEGRVFINVKTKKLRTCQCPVIEMGLLRRHFSEVLLAYKVLSKELSPQQFDTLRLTKPILEAAQWIIIDASERG